MIVPLYLPKTLTYVLPSELDPFAKVGCRVEVQIGKSKRYAGVIKRIHQHRPDFELKPILNLLDDEPILQETQLKLWSWIADYYMSSEGEVMIAALPAHLKLSSETIIQYNDNEPYHPGSLSDREYLLAEALEIKKELKISEVQKILDVANAYPVINKLIQKRICTVWEAMYERYKEKKETYLLLHPQYRNESALEELLNNWKHAPRQLDVLLSFLHLLKTEGQVTKIGLQKKTNAGPSVVEKLVEKEILQLDKRSVDRLPSLSRRISVEFNLSAAQQVALAALHQIMAEKSVTLLHGVTGSGKTMLYIKLFAEEVLKGRQCLFLLPEIALTSQIIRKLQQHFGGYVAVYHSKFNPAERVEIWNKVRSGEYQIVVGPRSALFLPYSNLSIIVVDEEHDPSYKQQEPPPRFHARDSAVYYAGLAGAKVILGSATPSVESYHHAITGKYGLVTLLERYGDLELPKIDLIDLKKIVRPPGEEVIISAQLLESIKQTLANGKQVIIFQNRRGYTPYQVCRTCGWIPKCQQCDVSLTYHKSTQKLHCHYCGSSYPLAKTCAQCGNHDFRSQRFGTEQLEEKLEQLLPDAKIARMDTDSVRGKNAHDTLIKQFEQQRIQVLVGTQMVVKGLDFDHVGLVGIPAGDSFFHFAEFRVNERAFQTLEQVSGRAGRKGEIGKVLLQIQDTAHPLLPYLMQHNYAGFFQVEDEARKAFFYPPYSRIIKIFCRHKDKQVCNAAIETFVLYMAAAFEKYLVGPSEPPVGRVRNLFIMECLLKLPRNSQVINQCKAHIHRSITDVVMQPLYKAASFAIDVDPQ